MQDQNQVLVPVNLPHGPPGIHRIGVACPQIEDHHPSLCKVHLRFSMFTWRVLSWAWQARFRLRGQDQIISKQEEQHRLPSQARPIWVPTQS